jgi:hypothetical protein
VNYERAMLRVRSLVASKSSHGRDTLLQQIAKIEQECEIPEPLSGYDGTPPVRPHPAVENNGDADTEHDEASLASTAA